MYPAFHYYRKATQNILHKNKTHKEVGKKKNTVNFLIFCAIIYTLRAEVLSCMAFSVNKLWVIRIAYM